MRKFVSALLLLVSAMCAWQPALAQNGWGTAFQGPALYALLNGLDSATVEKAFCVIAHRDIVIHEPWDGLYYTLHVDSVLPNRLAVDSAQLGGVQFRCPVHLLIAHWHLLPDDTIPSHKDSLAISRNPFLGGMLIVRQATKPLRWRFVPYLINEKGMPQVTITLDKP